jgi:hypothetical protein
MIILNVKQPDFEIKIQDLVGEPDVIFVAHSANCGNRRKSSIKPLKMAAYFYVAVIRPLVVFI